MSGIKPSSAHSLDTNTVKTKMFEWWNYWFDTRDYEF